MSKHVPFYREYRCQKKGRGALSMKKRFFVEKSLIPGKGCRLLSNTQHFFDSEF